MALHESIVESIQGFSLAKYATWFYYKPDRLLFDCGEGISSSLQNFVYGVKSIFLSHRHGDHVWGLPGFLLSRASSMGDHEKPVTIYYPGKDKFFGKLRRLIHDVLPRPPFEIHWQPIEAGAVIPLNAEGRMLRTFATGHLGGGRSLGAKVIEVRSRLKKEYSTLSQPEIVQIVREKGKDHISEKYEKILLAYGGDSPGLDPEVVKDAEVLLHEATFLAANDMEGEQHATVGQALEVGVAAGVRALVLFHISTRYRHREVKEAIRREISRLEPDFAIYYTFPRGFPTQLACVRKSASERSLPMPKS